MSLERGQQFFVRWFGQTGDSTRQLLRQPCRQTGGAPVKIRAQLEALEFGLGVAEFCDAHLCSGKPSGLGLCYPLTIDIAADFLLFHPHAEIIPIARPIMRAWSLSKNRPGKNVGPIETRQTQLSGTRIKP